MFVITAEVEGDEEKFLSIDDRDTGYPYWSNWFSTAKIFKSEDDARTFLQKEQTFYEPWFNGAPMSIHSGLGLCNARPEATGVFSIKQIVLNTVDNETVTGKINMK